MNRLIYLTLIAVLASVCPTHAQVKKSPPKHFTNRIGMKFVWIPAGSFVMGSPQEEVQRRPSETQHKVTLTKGFYMGVYTVTQEQWQEIMGNNPSNFNGEKNLPVENVSWDDCQEFIKKLRKKDKKAYRLPTEAEWEYACRAGTATAYSFGDKTSVLSEYAWFLDLGSLKTKPVGQKKPNAWGLYDMHGNVYQWCEDWRGDYPQEAVVDPKGPPTGEQRVQRGGSWAADPDYCRSAFSLGNPPYNRGTDFGFRLCFFVE